MKHIILLTLLISMALDAAAQGNLQFNQTRWITYTFAPQVPAATSTPFLDSTTIIVPVGKTLKIENATANYIYGNLPLNGGDAAVLVSIDDIVVRTSSALFTVFPFWLPSGTFKVKISGQVDGSKRVKLAISALEFNIIP